METTNTAIRVLTCSIYPDLTRIWYRVLAQTFGGTPPPTLIFDCSGRLRQEWFPGAEVRRIANWEHGRKIDRGLELLTGPEPVLVLDDDAFLLSQDPIQEGLKALNEDCRTAVFTMCGRGWWKLRAAGSLHVPMGSYALLLQPDIIRREKLSFRKVRTHDSAVRAGSGYWDTADRCHKELVERGYRVCSMSDARHGSLAPFFRTSQTFRRCVRRSIWTRNLARRGRPHRMEREFLAHPGVFAGGCSIAAVITMFRSMHDAPPEFTDWYSEDELWTLAKSTSPPSLKRRLTLHALEVRATKNAVLSAWERR